MLRDPIRTVLVPVDFGPASGQALALAGFLASASGARLVALHAESFELPPYFTLQQIGRYEAELALARERAVEHLREFVAGHTDWSADCVVTEERPAEAIAAAASDADLVIMGTHGRRGPGRWWLGSVAERVVRTSTVPVLVLHEGVDLESPAEVLSRVVVAGLHGPVPEPVVQWARGLVGRFQGELTMLGALERCGTDALSDATLVIVSLPAAGSLGSSAAQDAGPMLRACLRPVLFVRSLPGVPS